MYVILAILTGLFFSAGIFLLLSKSMVKLVMGMIFIGNANNILLFVINGIVRGSPALIESSLKNKESIFADPLPQALILTAIVISFGIQAFVIVLVKKITEKSNTKSTDGLNNTDKIDSKPIL